MRAARRRGELAQTAALRHTPRKRRATDSVSLCTARRPDPRRPRCEEKRETQRPLRPACGPFRACRQLGDTVPAARTRPTPSVGHVKSPSSAVCTIRCKNLGTNLGTVGRAGGSRCRRRRGDGTRWPQLPAAQRLVPEHPGARPGGDGGVPARGALGAAGRVFPKDSGFLSSVTKKHRNAKRKGGWGRGRHAGSLGSRRGCPGGTAPRAGRGEGPPHTGPRGGALAPTPGSKNENALLPCPPGGRSRVAVTQGHSGAGGWVPALSPTPPCPGASY